MGVHKHTHVYFFSFLWISIHRYTSFLTADLSTTNYAYQEVKVRTRTYLQCGQCAS